MNVHVRIMSDNTTAIYINKKGGLKSHKFQAAHIPGKDNFEEDKNLEIWKLNSSWIQKYTKLYVTPLVHKTLAYLPVGSTDKFKNVSL